MTIAQKVGELARRQDMEQAAREFCGLARCIALGRGDLGEAVHVAEDLRAGPRIREVLKAAVAAGSTSTTWGSQLIGYNILADAFLASLRSASCYDAMLPSMMRVPMRSQIAVLTGGATGSTVAEANVKLVSSLALSASQVTEMKSVAIVVLSQELVREGNDRLFSQALVEEVGYQTDLGFIARLTTGLSPLTSNGGTSVGVLQDVSAALAVVDTNASSQLFCITSPDIAKAWATKTTSTGEIAFPTVAPNGQSSICNMPLLITDAAANQILVVDATQIAAASSAIELSTTSEAVIQMDSAPTSPPTAATNVVSLWQQNWLGLKASRYWSAERLRTTAVGLVGSVTYTGSANSPA
jgi:hypothetical protein